MSNHKKDRQKDRGNWFVCVSHEPEQIEHLKQSCKNFKRWFYIEHDPDSEEGSHHIHVMVMYGGSCYIRTCARVLGIPENFVQFADIPRAYAQYMIHMNSPEKHQYQVTDVKTNVPGLYKSMLQEQSDSDVISLFDDLKHLELGRLSLKEFLDKHFSELQSMPFYQKCRLYSTLKDLSKI